MDFAVDRGEFEDVVLASGLASRREAERKTGSTRCRRHGPTPGRVLQLGSLCRLELARCVTQMALFVSKDLDTPRFMDSGTSRFSSTVNKPFASEAFATFT